MPRSPTRNVNVYVPSDPATIGPAGSMRTVPSQRSGESAEQPDCERVVIEAVPVRYANGVR